MAKHQHAPENTPPSEGEILSMLEDMDFDQLERALAVVVAICGEA